MPARVSIGTRFDDAFFGLSLFGAVAGVLVGALCLGMKSAEAAAVVFLVIAVLCGLVGAVRGFYIARGRRWLTPLDGGFLLEDRRGEFEFADDDVTDLGTWAKTRFKNGTPRATARKCHLTLRAGDAAAALDFEYEFPLSGADPLGGFLDRNLARLTDRAVAAQTAGTPLDGDGWTLDRAELVHGSGPKEVTVRVHEVAAAEVVGGKVCVWRNGEAEPIILIPAASPNALVLLRLLDRELTARPPRADEEAPGLGRIIFQRDHSTSKAAMVVVSALAAAGVAAGLVFGVMAAFNGAPGDMVLIALAVAGVPAAIWAIAFAKRVNVFRCHARGVCKLTPGRALELRYEDVAGFTYSATRHYYNGAYTGTQVSLRFEPRSGDAKDRVAYTAMIKNPDEELDNLRDFVSRVVASKLLARWKAGKAVAWTAGVRFLPDGLELPAGGVFGRGEPRELPYREIAGHQFQDGTFYLFRKGQKKAVFTTAVSAGNFFPGYYLLLALQSE